MRLIRQHTNFILLALVILLGIGAFMVTIRKVPIPSTIRLSVPFTSQAPAGNWDEPWQNACEETDIVMVDNFYRNETLTQEKAAIEIRSILSIKEQNFGKSKNETLESITSIIKAAKLPWQARVVADPTVHAIQEELVRGRPVIVPVDARMLTNPYYANITPEYHTLVLSGYDSKAKKFIVQDSGTDKGANFAYGFDELMAAIHDYTEPDISQGRKAVIFTTP